MAGQTYYITVNVIKDGRGCKGARVKRFNGEEKLTNEQGKVTIETENSEITIYVNGEEKYEGFTSKCPNPLNVYL